MSSEQPLFFECAGDELLGILHHPEDQQVRNGVLMVVGGPQYRVGSHRLFVLIARQLADAGIPVFRFDYRGMGDSPGGPLDFEVISDDIRAAADAFIQHAGGIDGVILWGLCDAATANAFYAIDDDRVVGQVALNPWVRTTEGEARTFIKHYYPRRALSGSFWLKLASLKYDLSSVFKEFLAYLRSSVGAHGNSHGGTHVPLPTRLRDAQTQFAAQTLLIVSGQDLTAKEYEFSVESSPEWQAWLASPKVEMRKLDKADHTFSTEAWTKQVAAWSQDWVKKLGREA